MNKPDWLLHRPIYLVYFLLTKPFRTFANKINKKMEKMLFLQKSMFFIAMGFLFIENISELISWLKFNYKSAFFIFFLGMTLVVYVWKYSDKRFGESWKAELKIEKEKKIKTETQNNSELL
jgi:hypothetical protein